LLLSAVDNQQAWQNHPASYFQPRVDFTLIFFLLPQVDVTQALLAFRDANKSSSLVDDWKGPSEQWRGLKTEEGELTEL
jgi:hypothetical protein